MMEVVQMFPLVHKDVTQILHKICVKIVDIDRGSPTCYESLLLLELMGQNKVTEMLKFQPKLERLIVPNKNDQVSFYTIECFKEMFKNPEANRFLVWDTMLTQFYTQLKIRDPEKREAWNASNILARQILDAVADMIQFVDWKYQENNYTQPEQIFFDICKLLGQSRYSDCKLDNKKQWDTIQVIKHKTKEKWPDVTFFEPMEEYSRSSGKKQYSRNQIKSNTAKPLKNKN